MSGNQSKSNIGRDLGQENMDNSQSVVIASDQTAIPVSMSGGATATAQTDGSQKTQIVDAGGEVVTVTGGKLDVNASVDTTGLATSTIQTDGSQKSQIVDAGGEAVTVTGGKLDVNAAIDTTGLATSAKQLPDGHSVALSATDNAVLDAIATSTDNIDDKTPGLGQALAAASVPVVLPVDQITTLTPPAAITGFATEAKQLPDGHNVTVDNGSGAAAVSIQDGGNSITVDGTVATTVADGADVTLGAKADAKSTATDTTAVSAMSVLKEISYMEQNPASRAVTNAGTFAVQVTAGTSGGATPYKNLDVDESEDEVKATAGQVFMIHAINLTATILYLKFYNLTAANTTVGTSTPVFTFPVPSLATTNGAGFNISLSNGFAFDTAITIAATTGFADNDTGAPAANALIVNLGYK